MNEPQRDPWGVLFKFLLGGILFSALQCNAANAQAPPESGHRVHNPFSAGNRYREETPELRWILRGTLLMVGRGWILNPNNGRLSHLPYATAKDLGDGGTELFGIALSPLGEQVAVWDERVFSFGPVLSGLGQPLPFPDDKLEASDQGGAQEALKSILFWRGERELVLYQIADNHGSRPACKLFDTRSRTWQPMAPCPEGDFLRIDRIDSGRGGLIAIHSSGEGVPGFRVARFDRRNGQHDVRAPDFSLYPMGRVEVAFHSKSERIDIATPCLLHRLEGACVDANERSSWRLYSWSPGSAQWILRRGGLPPHSVPSPEGTLLAWPLKNRVCVAPVTSLEKRRCYHLPR